MSERSGRRPVPRETRTLVAAVVGFLVTATVVLAPQLRFAYENVAGRLVLETAATLVAALVAVLLYGRYRRTGALSELLLVHGMALLAAGALFFVTIPGLVGERTEDTATSWAALLVRLVAAVLVLAAALTPADRVYRVAHPLRDALVGGVVLVVIAVAVTVLAPHLPDVVSTRVPAEASARPVLEGHPVVLAAQWTAFVCYAGAAVGFTRRSVAERDDVLGWFGAAAALGAWARLCYLIFPSLYSGYLYAGDVLRLGFSVLLLVAALVEIRTYWAAQAELAVAAERRRLARDLHDGVIQEIGYIRAQASREVPVPRDVVVAAADRAMDEARRALQALTGPYREGPGRALERAVTEVADRYDVPLTFTADPLVTVPQDHVEALVRIAREAVGNAVRHAGAQRVTVVLRDRALTVRDDGRGFDASTAARSGGFGLTSMRERAEAMGARLTVESAPGRGTEVRTTWGTNPR